MGKVILDTSFLVSYYNTRDENHNKSKVLMKELLEKNSEVFISDYIFDECCTILLFRLKDLKKSVEICEVIKEIEMFKVEESCFERTFEIFKSQKGIRLSFTDCSSLALIEMNGIREIASFDKEFKKISWIKFNVLS